MKPRHVLSQRLAEQKVLLGLMQTVPHPMLGEMAAICGYDFLILDSEHGFFGELEHLQALLTLGSAGIGAFVRMREHDPQAVGRYLDMGADGILVPNVSSAAQAASFARAMEYPPAGIRHCAGPMTRASCYGVDFAAHLKAPRAGTLLAVMIETALGVANVEDILAVAGVDAVIVGPFDLTADLGFPGDFSHPDYTQALARIERAAAAHGKILGTAPHPGNPIEALLARGHRLITVGTDITLLREAMAARVATARACL